MQREVHTSRLSELFPPSEPCSCDVCLRYCSRPGWWTPDEAEEVLHTRHARRMMLEISPEFTFGVLSPAFRGCEAHFAQQEFAANGCTFLRNGACELHGTRYQPLECRFCHHERVGQGNACHAAVEQAWHSALGRALVDRWIKQTRFKHAAYFYRLIKP